MLQATVWWHWLHLYVHMCSVIIVNDETKESGLRCLHDIAKSCLLADYFDLNYELFLFLLPFCCWSLHPKQNLLFKISLYLPQMQNAVLRRIWYIFSWTRNDLQIAMMSVNLFICTISRCDHTIKCASARLRSLVEFLYLFFMWLKKGTYYAFPLYTDIFVSSRVLSLPVLSETQLKMSPLLCFRPLVKHLTSEHEVFESFICSAMFLNLWA